MKNNPISKDPTVISVLKHRLNIYSYIIIIICNMGRIKYMKLLFVIFKELLVEWHQLNVIREVVFIDFSWCFVDAPRARYTRMIMDPLATEPIGDSDDEHDEDLECSADMVGGASSEHNSPKSSSTRDCSPLGSTVEMADSAFTREEHFLSDNGDTSVHSCAKPIRLPSRATGFRLSDGHKKSVQMQFDGRKIKPAVKTSIKKEKQPVR